MKTILFPVFFIVLVIISCGKPEKVKNAEAVVAAFFTALKNGDTTKIKTIYPEFSKLPVYFKSDSFTLGKYHRNNNSIEIEVNNQFTNINKKTFSQKIIMIVSDNSDNMQILDSRGMSDFKGNELYEFGRKTGCVSSDTTLSDQTIVKHMERAALLLKEESKNLIEELKVKVPVTDLKTSNLFSYISGSARITNNSPYPLYFVKYVVNLIDENGTILKSDDGYAAVDTLYTGMDKPFSFFLEPPPGTKTLDIRIAYDHSFLLSCLTSKKWTGNECDKIPKK